jgi:hypothetical protein
LKPLDLFKAGIIAGDVKCLKIEEIVKANSFTIGFSYKEFKQIGAIQALFSIVDDYGFEVLDDTLCIIANTWAGIGRATSGDCLLGVAEFVHRYGVLDFDKRLSDSFQAIWYEYRENTRRGKANARKCFCKVLVDFYNKGLGRGKNRLKWEG